MSRLRMIFSYRPMSSWFYRLYYYMLLSGIIIIGCAGKPPQVLPVHNPEAKGPFAFFHRAYPNGSDKFRPFRDVNSEHIKYADMIHYVDNKMHHGWGIMDKKEVKYLLKNISFLEKTYFTSTGNRQEDFRLTFRTGGYTKYRVAFWSLKKNNKLDYCVVLLFHKDTSVTKFHYNYPSRTLIRAMQKVFTKKNAAKYSSN